MELTTLSWMLLAADRGEVLWKLFTLFFVLSLFFTITRGCLITVEENLKDFKVLPWWIVVLLLGWGIPMVAINLVPSTTVILQVAAIELGDDVLNSDEFQRILNAFVPKE